MAITSEGWTGVTKNIYRDWGIMPTDATPNPLESRYYEVNVVCSNCDYAGPMEVPMGRKAPSNDKPGICPNCACHTAAKPVVRAQPNPHTWQQVGGSSRARFGHDNDHV